MSAPFSDPDSETWTAAWDWGDGTSSSGTVAGFVVSGSHAYTTPGLYTIFITITDDGGGIGSASYQYVVVYDPAAGFVTGGGWIQSLEGTYLPDPGAAGKASFEFDIKYNKGAGLPAGSTVFQFPAAGLDFQSTGYDWLVVAGQKAIYQGSGTVNGQGEYKFMLAVMDGSDRFRIKIWEEDAQGNASVLYDNQPGAEATADPVTALGGGSIVIHKAK